MNINRIVENKKKSTKECQPNSQRVTGLIKEENGIQRREAEFILTVNIKTPKMKIRTAIMEEKHHVSATTAL
jgi:hypothetical protein